MSKRKTILEVQAELPDVLILKYENNQAATVKYGCGHVASGVTAGSLREGKRCGRCSPNTPKGLLEYQAEFDDPLVIKVEDARAVTVKYECGHVAKARASDLRRGDRCGRCSPKAPKGVLERQAEFGDVIVLKVEDSRNIVVKYECGHVATTRASHLKNGHRCGCRRPGGYKTNKPGWLYFMERPGEMQVGITNVPDRRLKEHARDGWELVEMDGPHDGTAILNRENAIKKHLKTNDLLIEGTQENWPTAMWSPQSLATIEHAAQQLVAA